MLGADVDSDIPDRMKDGYGLNRNLIDRALEADVDTIITCDNGIAAKKNPHCVPVKSSDIQLSVRL